MTTDELWRRISDLEGRTLLTTSRKRPFKVVAVAPAREYAIRIRVESSGNEYPIACQAIDCAHALGFKGSELRPGVVRRRHCSNFHPAYVVAILKEVGADS